MITYIIGEFTEIEENTIIIEAYGVGYEVTVPASVVSMLPPLRSNLKMYTYQNVKEDALDLYGFLTKDDLNIFKLLITVNGIGPKGALSILSSISPDDLRIAVVSDDVKRIQSAPGIGAKTAQKLIIELKDKLKLEDVLYKSDTEVKDAPSGNVRDEAVEALCALGYSPSEALRAVKNIDIKDGMNSEDILKMALKKLAFI
jgi:Holliday junction DNA helicase RuvA